MSDKRPRAAPFRAERTLFPFLAAVIVAVLLGFVLGLMASLSRPDEMPVPQSQPAPDAPRTDTGARKPAATPAPFAAARSPLESEAVPEPCWPNQVLPIC